MSTRNAKVKKLRKYDNIGGRKHTVDSLNLGKLGKNFTVVSRHTDPNYCNILFDDCGHEKLVTIGSVLKQRPICYDCIDSRLQDEALLTGYELLVKIPHGVGKSKHETRLAKCTTCGTFKFLHPASLRSNKARCGICHLNEVNNLVDGTQWEILNKIDSCNVRLQCKSCQHLQDSQVSNLKRYIPLCKNCNVGYSEKSFVYGFIINSQIGRFIKIGKSNNPYLRHLRFISSGKEVTCDFIGKLKFDTQLEAFKFEKILFKRFENYKILPEIGKQIIDSGWTELFSEHIEDELRGIFK